MNLWKPDTDMTFMSMTTVCNCKNKVYILSRQISAHADKPARVIWCLLVWQQWEWQDLRIISSLLGGL